MSVKQTYRDIKELTENAQKACRLFMAECERCGLNVLITETYRSQERQNYLYSLGRTVAGQKVTWTKNSRHTSRRAWDICKNVKGSEYSDSGFFEKCGEIAEKYGITWGGRWSTPDTPHFEIAENWSYNKSDESEECEMTIEEKQAFEELKKRVAELEDKLGVKYGYIDENMPEWAREAVRCAVEKGIVKGDENGNLGLSYNDLRAIVREWRAGVYE